MNDKQTKVAHVQRNESDLIYAAFLGAVIGFLGPLANCSLEACFFGPSQWHCD